MNKDSYLIFEAYKKRLTETTDGSYMPSDEEIQSALKRLKCRCTVEEVKSVVENALQHYRPTSEDDFKSGLYEDYQDSVNYSPMGGGKPRFNYKEHSIAELATLLARQLRDNRMTKERNARGENAEESSSITMDVLIKAIEEALQPYRGGCSVCYLGQVMDKVEEKGYKLWGAGSDRDAFNKVWKEFVSKNAYCYDMSATDSYDMDEERPRFSDNKIDKNGPGEYLFMEGSGRGPDVYLACEFAKEHGYNKLILNGLS